LIRLIEFQIKVSNDLAIGKSIKEIRGIHDWQKFIKPEEITDLMDKNGFTNI